MGRSVYKCRRIVFLQCFECTFYNRPGLNARKQPATILKKCPGSEYAKYVLFLGLGVPPL